MQFTDWVEENRIITEQKQRVQQNIPIAIMIGSNGRSSTATNEWRLDSNQKPYEGIKRAPGFCNLPRRGEKDGSVLALDRNYESVYILS